MTAKREIKVTITGDKDSLSRTLKGADADLGKFGNSADANTKKVSKSVGGLSTSIKGLATAAAAYGALNFLKEANAEAEEAAKVSRLTDAAIKSTGGVANVTAAQLDELAASLSRKAAVDDETVQSAANVLLTFTKVRNEVGAGNDVFNQGAEAALNMSAALGQDLQAATTMVGKALNDPIRGITAMTRAGVQFTDQQKSQIAAMVETGDILGAQKVILGELGTQFGGAAEAAATGSQKLKVASDNLKEAIGSGLAPTVDRLGDALMEMAPETQANVVKFGALAVAGGGTAVALGAVVDGTRKVTKGVKDFAAPIGTMVSNLREARASGRSLGDTLKSSLTPATVGLGTATIVATALIADVVRQKREHVAVSQEVAAAIRAEREGTEGSVDAWAAEELARRGLIDSANEMGISTQTLVAAIRGEGDAMDEVKSKARAFYDEHVGVLKIGLYDAEHQVESFRDQVAKLSKGYVSGAEAERQFAAATKELAGDVAGAEDATVKLSVAVENLGEHMDAAEKKAFGLADTTVAYHEALREARAALEENGGTLDLSTKKGAANYEQLKNLVLKTNDQVEQLRLEGATRREANAAADEGREAIRRLAEQYGLAEKDVRFLIKAVEDVPDRKKFRIDADTADAQRKLDALVARLDSIERRSLSLRPGSTPNHPLPKVGGAGGRTSTTGPLTRVDGFEYNAASTEAQIPELVPKKLRGELADVNTSIDTLRALGKDRTKAQDRQLANLVERRDRLQNRAENFSDIGYDKLPRADKIRYARARLRKATPGSDEWAEWKAELDTLLEDKTAGRTPSEQKAADKRAAQDDRNEAAAEYERGEAFEDLPRAGKIKYLRRRLRKLEKRGKKGSPKWLQLRADLDDLLDNADAGLNDAEVAARKRADAAAENASRIAEFNYSQLPTPEKIQYAAARVQAEERAGRKGSPEWARWIGELHSLQTSGTTTTTAGDALGAFVGTTFDGLGGAFAGRVYVTNIHAAGVQIDEAKLLEMQRQQELLYA